MSRIDNLMPEPWLAWLQCGALAVVAILLAVLPGAPYILTLLAMAACGAISVWAYRNTHAYTVTGEGVLTVAMTLLAAGLIINVWYFTTAAGGTDASPVLQNPDAWRYWNDALAYLGQGGVHTFRTHSFYGAIVAAWMWLPGPSITWALMLNMACIIFALVMCSVLTYVVTHERRTAALAMACMACVCYLMTMGTVLLKDAWVIACVAGAGAALSRWRGWISVLQLSIAALALAAVRPNYVLAIIAGIVITAFAFSRGKTLWPQRWVAIAICCALVVFPNLMHYTNPVVNVLAPGYSDIFYSSSQQRAFFLIVGDYMVLPFWQKLILLPITAGVQFLIPFPWNFARDVIYGPTQAWAHIAYPWYAFGGVAIFYFFARKVRRVGLTMFALWGVLLWLVPCYTVGGTVSRYALPAVAILAPCVAVTLRECRRRQSFALWCAIFALAVSIILAVCFYLQTAYA